MEEQRQQPKKPSTVEQEEQVNVDIVDEMPEEAVEASDSLEANPVEEVEEKQLEKPVKDVEVMIEAPRTEITEAQVKQQEAVEKTGAPQVKVTMPNKLEAGQEQVEKGIEQKARDSSNIVAKYVRQSTVSEAMMQMRQRIPSISQKKL